jgi:hypothetical protein
MRGARVKQLRRAYRTESEGWDKTRPPLFGFRRLKRLWLQLKNTTAALDAARGPA